MPRKAEPPVGKGENAYNYGTPRVVTIGPEGDRRDVHDVNDVLRDICWDLIQDAEWSQLELAKKMGIGRSALNDFMSGGRSTDGILTGLCAVLDSDPIDVLAQHRLFADHARSVIRTKDALFQKFQRELRIDQARRFVRAIEEAKKQRRLETVLKVLAELLDADLSDGDDELSSARNSERKPPKLRGVKK